jgi:sulfatase maturation enzyme AslB (radical SAM superfamily)
MVVSGQRHAPAALYPRGNDPRYPLYRRMGGPQSRSGHSLVIGRVNFSGGFALQPQDVPLDLDNSGSIPGRVVNFSLRYHVQTISSICPFSLTAITWPERDADSFLHVVPRLRMCLILSFEPCNSRCYYCHYYHHYRHCHHICLRVGITVTF